MINFIRTIPFGYVFWLSAVLGYLLGDLWLDLEVSEEWRFSDSHLLFSFLVGTVYVFFLGRWFWQVPWKSVFVTYILGVLYVFFVLIGRILTIWEPNTLAVLTMPLLFAFGPMLIVYSFEYIREYGLLRQFLIGSGGSSRFGTVSTIVPRTARFNRSLFQPGGEGLTAEGIVIGRSLFRHDPFPRVVSLNDESHLVTIAGTRSGKSVTCLYNNLLTYDGSVVVIDPKGELCKTTMYRRASRDFLSQYGIGVRGVDKHFEHGETYVLDPCRISGITSFHYNPFDETDIDEPDCREILTAIADGIIMPEGERNKHFEDFAKDVFKGLSVYMMATLPKERHNLPMVLDMLSGIDEDGFANLEKFDELLLDMQTCGAVGGLAQQVAIDLQKMGERERGSVLSTLSRNLKWVGDPAMRTHLAKPSDFKYAEFGNRKVTTEGKTYTLVQTAYVILPDTRYNDLMRWIRMHVSVGTVAMRRRCSLPEKSTLWILDEMPLLRKIQSISEGYGLFAGYKIKLWSLMQNLGQLKKAYKEWEVILSNSNVQIFGLAITDPDTPKYTSEKLGKHKINDKGGHRKELLTETEVVELIGKGKRKQIIFAANSSFALLLDRLGFKFLKIDSTWFWPMGLGGLKGHFYDLKQKK